MNAYDRDIGKSGLAVLHYGDGDFAVLSPGQYVVCAVTGAKVPLEALRYWSPELQEAYATPKEALKRWQETKA
ncbi:MULTISPECIES: DUF2093 domain-containing protein [Caulobacter]|uniref:DUF2093 domain-containing protein n=1 Tax=Caulobacter hibisci TaxID=2035993 RepID=A0ABS0T0Z3_9CAUL|nr:MULTISPECIES: DUF2093 domain-containing protein [Caulobacter]MBI1685519.1 DUF2093 domain-containing protein [Caulobacter hibisci]PXA89992.1 DUF2093 domain-containing protein [Caulobacter sp. D4A]PXA94997.1 DUF2093 domain-containing protein [Caulobacter sp. D5]